jgi:glycosyltransferase involved in cell wall biosynthesis
MYFQSQDVFLSVGALWAFNAEPIVRRLKELYGLKVCIFLYDLIPLIMPQWAKPGSKVLFAEYIRFISDVSNIILFASESSLNDAEREFKKAGLNFCEIDRCKIRLGDFLPQADDLSITGPVGELETHNFILYVSTIEARKNHSTLYHAYHMLCSEGEKDGLPTLVFVGRVGWGVDELLGEIYLDPVVAGKIKIISSASDSELDWLYKNSLFCVYPSLYEGWGLPVGEALSYGKVIVASDSSSLPEAGSSHVLYINQWDTVSWRDVIIRLVSDNSYRSSLERNIKNSYCPTSWLATGNQIFSAIYNETNCVC